MAKRDEYPAEVQALMVAEEELRGVFSGDHGLVKYLHGEKSKGASPAKKKLAQMVSNALRAMQQVRVQVGQRIEGTKRRTFLDEDGVLEAIVPGDKVEALREPGTQWMVLAKPGPDNALIVVQYEYVSRETATLWFKVGK